MLDGQDWWSSATCRGDNAAYFFAPNHFERKPEKDAREARARALCLVCPVQRNCLTHALAAGEAHGIWGGLNELQRKRLARKLAATDAQAC